MRINLKMLVAALATTLAMYLVSTAAAGTSNGSLSFTNTPLVRAEGESEPALSFAANGTMAISGLQWLFDPTFFGTHLWTGPFGSTPTFRGLVDADLHHPGKQIFGSGDADADFGSTGTLHVTTLIFLVNPAFTAANLGVSAITCPNATAITFSIAGCTKKIIDTAGADRQWITSDGSRVWISYHDSKNSSLIHVQRSDDDGLTWHRVGDPIVGQGSATGDATFNNEQGPIVADPKTHTLYAVYNAGEASVQKGTSFFFNNVYVSRSTDGGVTWIAERIFHAPLFTRLNNVFPVLTVDPTNGHVYVVWSDGQHISFMSNAGIGWSSPVTVNIAPANTAVMAFVAAYNGKVDVVYYGTSGANNTSADWHTYLARTTNEGASFLQSAISGINHHGEICLDGTGCGARNRNLLDLFENAIDHANGKSAVIYTDDTLTTDSDGNPLPQIVLAQEN